MRLLNSYYLSNDVISIANDLIGKCLFSNIGGKLTGGIITETEAYAGIEDQASHAYGNRRTSRTETMYSQGGISYVYLCYGIHNLFNVVVGDCNNPLAILIRGIYPVVGIEFMKDRTIIRKSNKLNTNGPGKLSKALGIGLKQNGISLTGDIIWIEDLKLGICKDDIHRSRRIGIDYAGNDALLPYRFFIDESIIKKKAP